MRNTGRKPPILLRWLDAEQRISLAEKVRDKASDVAEWIAPEIAPEGREQASRAPLRWIGAMAVAAAIVVAFCLYDASAEIGIGTPPATQRATVGAW